MQCSLGLMQKYANILNESLPYLKGINVSPECHQNVYFPVIYDCIIRINTLFYLNKPCQSNIYGANVFPLALGNNVFYGRKN